VVGDKCLRSAVSCVFFLETFLGHLAWLAVVW